MPVNPGITNPPKNNYIHKNVTKTSKFLMKGIGIPNKKANVPAIKHRGAANGL